MTHILNNIPDGTYHHPYQQHYPEGATIGGASNPF